MMCFSSSADNTTSNTNVRANNFSGITALSSKQLEDIEIRLKKCILTVRLEIEMILIPAKKNIFK